MSEVEKIYQLILTEPGLKARQIASKLGLDRASVNSMLYRHLKGKLVQDSSYRWWPRDSNGQHRNQCTEPPNANTPLSRLCRYYLDCLSQDTNDGISVFATSNFNDLDYTELNSFPYAEIEPDHLFSRDGAKRLLGKIQKDRNRLMMYLGYPVRRRFFHSKKGWEGYMVDPIFLFPLHHNDNNRYAEPTLGEELPFLNFSVLKSFIHIGSGNLMDESIQLSEELGLNNIDNDLPEIDELVARLIDTRPGWDWNEKIDPYNLSKGIPLSEMVDGGIYNRAILIVCERSPYTRGLETELGRLENTKVEQITNTALGNWINGIGINPETPSNVPLLEVLPLNSEQRQAVINGLINPLTVITGPPGTGKSQVVTSLLINAAWQGKKVLFASKNNKAVDVVETRVNSLGSRPILLRMGRNEFMSKLSDHIASLLGSSVSEDDETDYNNHLKIHEALGKKLSDIETDLHNVVSLRNKVDSIEREVEQYRTLLGKDIFHSYKSKDFKPHIAVLKNFGKTIENADIHEQSLMIRFLWGFLRNARYSRVLEACQRLNSIAAFFDLEIPKDDLKDSTLYKWKDFYKKLTDRIDPALKIQEYFSSLYQLIDCKSMEDISKEKSQVIDQLSENSEKLWESWIHLQPARMNQNERRLLSEYNSILQMIIAGGENNHKVAREVFRKYYTLFPQITNLLPCWAVTSLSARNKIPFESEFFDILVIDEASQCDIASALPLLFRAKNVVIIGDPQQLKHISTLSDKQDTQLLAKHELIEGHTIWAYSYNSLFDLARSLCKSEDLIDLRDHHRSHSEIITFSNNHFYEGRLRIATKYNQLKFVSKDEAAIRWVDIRGNVARPTGGGAINDIEAKRVVDELERLFKQGYSGSIGVVSPFRAQANKIRDMVNQRDGLLNFLVNLGFLSDTVHRFQGDERDLIIFSPVVSSGITKGAEGFLTKNPNLFNVAITRARSTLIVVGDIQSAINSNIDYLSKFASYIQNLDKYSELKKTIPNEYGSDYPTVAKPELVSDWERLFYKKLYLAGIRPIPQYDEEQYILDFAIFNNSQKLNIEIDGERYHRNWNGELCRRDQIRNQRLIELGWDIMRFWVYQIRDDMDNCIESVKSWLNSTTERER